MPFCYRCGRELPSNAKFCDACGVAAPIYLPPRSKPARNLFIGIASTLLLYFKDQRRLLKILVIYLVVFFASIYYFFPVLWIFLNSFRTGWQVHGPLLEFRFTPAIYRSLFSDVGFYKYVMNSLVIGVATVLLSLLIGAPAAYVLARLGKRIAGPITTWVIIARALPAFGIIVPFYILIISLKLFDTQIGVILAHLTFSFPLTVWFLSTYFSQMPVELEESAMIDGCGRIQALLRITVPVSLPAIMAVSILCFLFSWNEFLFAFMLTSKDARTIPVIIATITGVAFQIDYPAMCAASTFCMLPAFVFISYVQKYVVRGLTMGAVK